MDHKAAGKFPVHSLEERDSHDKSVGESGDGEESDGPLQAAALADPGPDGEDGEDYELLESVCGDEAGVHGVGVVGGDEMEGE